MSDSASVMLSPAATFRLIVSLPPWPLIVRSVFPLSDSDVIVIVWSFAPMLIVIEPPAVG